jgi:shikimate kinase
VQNAKHIFFCGFMGSGKSTHGKKLAAIIKQPFVDLDQHIQNKEHKTVQFIFDNEGEDEFRKLETKYLNELVKLPAGHVISLGGGTVCFNNNLDLIKKNGLLIYIEIPAAALAERLQKSKQKRPLLKNVLSENLNIFIEEKLNERNLFYRQAHITVEGLNLNHRQLYQTIIEYHKANNSR